MRIKNINNKIELFTIFEFEYVCDINKDINWIRFSNPFARKVATYINAQYFSYIDIKEDFGLEVLKIVLDNLSIFKHRSKKKVIEYGLI